MLTFVVSPNSRQAAKNEHLQQSPTKKLVRFPAGLDLSSVEGVAKCRQKLKDADNEMRKRQAKLAKGKKVAPIVVQSSSSSSTEEEESSEEEEESEEEDDEDDEEI